MSGRLFEHLRTLPDGSLTTAEVNVILDKLEKYRDLAEISLDEIERLRVVVDHPIVRACIGLNSLQFPELALTEEDA